MKRPNFMEGVLVGLIASIAGSALFVTLKWFMSYNNALELIIVGISFAYTVYLLSRSPEKTGRIVVMASWLVSAAIMWVMSLPLMLVAMIHIGMVWLIRSLYFYSSILPALIDLMLSAFSLVIAIWAGLHTSSLFLSVWCFFLTQTLFVFIPHGGKKQSTQHPSNEQGDSFESAHRSAEAALRKLSSIS